MCNFAAPEIVPSVSPPPPATTPNDLTNGTSAAAPSAAVKRGYEQTNGLDAEPPAAKRANMSSVIKQNISNLQKAAAQVRVHYTST